MDSYLLVGLTVRDPTPSDRFDPPYPLLRRTELCEHAPDLHRHRDQFGSISRNSVFHASEIFASFGLGAESSRTFDVWRDVTQHW